LPNEPTIPAADSKEKQSPREFGRTETPVNLPMGPLTRKYNFGRPGLSGNPPPLPDNFPGVKTFQGRRKNRPPFLASSLWRVVSRTVCRNATNDKEGASESSGKETNPTPSSDPGSRPGGWSMGRGHWHEGKWDQGKKYGRCKKKIRGAQL